MISESGLTQAHIILLQCIIIFYLMVVELAATAATATIVHTQFIESIDGIGILHSIETAAASEIAKKQCHENEDNDHYIYSPSPQGLLFDDGGGSDNGLATDLNGVSVVDFNAPLDVHAPDIVNGTTGLARLDVRSKILSQVEDADSQLGVSHSNDIIFDGINPAHQAKSKSNSMSVRGGENTDKRAQAMMSINGDLCDDTPQGTNPILSVQEPTNIWSNIDDVIYFAPKRIKSGSVDLEEVLTTGTSNAPGIPSIALQMGAIVSWMAPMYLVSSRVAVASSNAAVASSRAAIASSNAALASSRASAQRGGNDNKNIDAISSDYDSPTSQLDNNNIAHAKMRAENNKLGDGAIYYKPTESTITPITPPISPAKPSIPVTNSDDNDRTAAAVYYPTTKQSVAPVTPSISPAKPYIPAANLEDNSDIIVKWCFAWVTRIRAMFYCALFVHLFLFSLFVLILF